MATANLFSFRVEQIVNADAEDKLARKVRDKHRCALEKHSTLCEVQSTINTFIRYTECLITVERSYIRHTMHVRM